MQSKQDTAQFYKIVNSLLRYKSRGKIVKGIRNEEEIIMGILKDKIVKQFFEKLYNSNEQPYKVPSNGIFDLDSIFGKRSNTELQIKQQV